LLAEAGLAGLPQDVAPVRDETEQLHVPAADSLGLVDMPRRLFFAAARLALDPVDAA